jgi:hypothetical protein
VRTAHTLHSGYGLLTGGEGVAVDFTV